MSDQEESFTEEFDEESNMDFDDSDDFDDDEDSSDKSLNTQLMVLGMVRKLTQLLDGCFREEGDRIADSLNDVEIAMKEIGDYIRSEYNVGDVEEFDKIASLYGDSGIKMAYIRLEDDPQYEEDLNSDN